MNCNFLSLYSQRKVSFSKVCIIVSTVLSMNFTLQRTSHFPVNRSRADLDFRSLWKEILDNTKTHENWSWGNYA